MGVHRISSVGYAWNNERVPSHLPRQYVSRTRFEQIHRFLKVSNPEEDEERKQSKSKEWWYKMEPSASKKQLGSIIAQVLGSLSLKSWSDVSDAQITPAECHRNQSSRGYKIFALAERGYVIDIAWTSRLWDIMELFKDPGLSPTASMVLNLVHCTLLVQCFAMATPSAPRREYCSCGRRSIPDPRLTCDRCREYGVPQEISGATETTATCST